MAPKRDRRRRGAGAEGKLPFQASARPEPGAWDRSTSRASGSRLSPTPSAPPRHVRRTSARPLVVVVGGIVAVVVAVAVRGHATIDVPTAVALGVIEGVTEFLPVSSTGHLAVAERLLDLRGSAADAYVIVIQAGAILAVVMLYRRRLGSIMRGVVGRDRSGRRLAGSVALSFLPAAFVGVLFADMVKDRLFGVGPVAFAWAAGGLFIVIVGRRSRTDAQPLESIDCRQAVLIGVAQTVALWPGVSRSLVTIVAASAVGLSLPAAIEFSFLLGFVTLGAATAFEAVGAGPEIVRAYGIAAPAIGFVVAFAAAVVSVQWMVAYLRNGSLAVFGYYRLAAATVAATLLATGVL